MQKKLLTNGNVFKRTDGRWCGVVWYQEVSKKIKDYIAAFEDANSASHESKKRLRESMQGNDQKQLTPWME